MIEKIIKYIEDNKINSVLHIGCNCGEYLSKIKQSQPGVKICGIDANESCSDFLAQNNIPHQIVCLSDECGLVDFYISNNNSTCSGASFLKELTYHYSDGNYKVIKKKTYKLDDILDDKYDLIIIDTQGSELKILNGALKLLEQCSHIVCEVSLIPYNENAPLKQEVVEYMNKHNFYLVEKIEEHYCSDKKCHDMYGKVFQEDCIFKKEYK